MTLLVVALLAAHIVLACVAVQAVLVFIEIAWRAVAGRAEYRALVATHIAQFRMLRAIQLALWLVTATAVVRWVGRAHANLTTLGATGLRYAPAQAMRAFLVPGYNLGRPVGVLRELWNASDPRSPAGMTWRAAPLPARLRWWWGLLLCALTLEAMVRGLTLYSGLVLDLGRATQVLLVGQLLTAATAVLGIAFVLGVDNRQEAAAWRRTSAEPGR